MFHLPLRAGSHLLLELLREKLLGLSPWQYKNCSPISYGFLSHVAGSLDTASDQGYLTNEGNVEENGGGE